MPKIHVPDHVAHAIEAEVKEKETATKETKSTTDNIPYIEPGARVLDPTLLDKSILQRMPQPTGWRILILPYRGKGQTEGGIYLPDQMMEQQHVSTQVGYVLKVGPLAYKDPEKFPTGPWCEEKDWVMFARYAGSRFSIDGGEVRILNDDEVLAKILSPEDVLHF